VHHHDRQPVTIGRARWWARFKLWSCGTWSRCRLLPTQSPDRQRCLRKSRPPRYLADDASAFMTGSVLIVDDGYTLY